MNKSPKKQLRPAKLEGTSSLKQYTEFNPIGPGSPVKNRNIYVPIRDFGPRGWNLFSASVLLADRIDLWLPSGADLKAANEAGGTFLTERDVIDLIKSKRVRVGGREFNFQKNSAQGLNVPGDSELDVWLSEEVRQGRLQDQIVLHENYEGSRLAFEQLTAMQNELSKETKELPFSDTALNRAFMCYDRWSRKGDEPASSMISIPAITRKRSIDFLSMEADEIIDKDMREAYRLIKSLHIGQEGMERYSIAFQLVRLSIEHMSIKQTQGCSTNTAEIDHARMYSFVANEKGIVSRERLDPETYLDRMIELIDFLTDQEPIRNARDLIERHEKLKDYRDQIWRLTELAHDPLETVSRDLSEFLQSRNSIPRLFGQSRWAQVLSGASLVHAIASTATAALTGVSVIGIAFALGSPLLQLLDSRRQGDTRLWPVIAALNTEKPTRDQIRTVLIDIKEFRKFH
jgi:hypothetical protein